MATNTDLADINELYVGYFLMGEKWWNKEAHSQVIAKTKKVGLKEHDIQKERARVMSVEIVKWAKKNGYSGRVKDVHWTARKDALDRILKCKIDEKMNPTDILVQFTSGPVDGYLGISAKSTKGPERGFKNPGIASVEAVLKISIQDIVDKDVKKLMKEFDLPLVSTERKIAIRKSRRIAGVAKDRGAETLEKIRDVMFSAMKKMSNKDLQDYIIENWLNASNDLYPPYVKVTGAGSKPGAYKATVSDPLKNDKLSAVLKGPIRITKQGNTAIGISAGSKHIFKMRAKFKDESLASNVKFSADAWT